MICRWCGEPHEVDRLCARAQRGMTRRSFCFLFGAGVGAMVLGVGPTEPQFRHLRISDELLRDSAVDVEALVREEMIASLGACLDGFLELLRPRTLVGRIPGGLVPFTVGIKPE